MAENPTKQRIIETACALFQEKGYDDVTVSDICAACGITKTTFYYHLKSKEEIVTQFYEAATQNLADRMLDILAAKNYWEQLMVCFDTLVQTSTQFGPGLGSQLIIINLREDKGTFDLRESLTRTAVLLIEKAQNAGQIRNQSSPLQLYRASAYAYMGFETMWCFKKGAFDRGQYVRQAMENIYDVDPALRTGDVENETTDPY